MSRIDRMSKAALNMGAQELAIKGKEKSIHVLTLAPGCVRTDMGGDSARLSTEESVEGMMEVVNNFENLKWGFILFLGWKGIGMVKKKQVSREETANPVILATFLASSTRPHGSHRQLFG